MGARSAAANCMLAMSTAVKSSFCMIFSKLGKIGRLYQVSMLVAILSFQMAQTEIYGVATVNVTST